MKLQEAIELNKEIKHHIKGLYIVGSLRIKEEEIDYLDYITKRDLNDVFKDFDNWNNGNIQIIREGNLYISFYLTGIEWVKIDIWRARDIYEYDFLKVLRSMDKGHNIWLRLKAISHGYKLSDRGMTKIDNDEKIAIKNKKDLYKYINGKLD